MPNVWWTDIAISPVERPPFPVDAVVYEEDTYLVLSAEPELSFPGEHPVRVMTEAHQAVPAKPGTVVVRAGHPLNLLAVVHKLDEDPTWREEWVASALTSVLREVERRQIRAIRLPLLATVHGQLTRDRFLTLLVKTLGQAAPPALERLWLCVPPGTEGEVANRLSESKETTQSITAIRLTPL